MLLIAERAGGSSRRSQPEREVWRSPEPTRNSLEPSLSSPEPTRSLKKAALPPVAILLTAILLAGALPLCASAQNQPPLPPQSPHSMAGRRLYGPAMPGARPQQQPQPPSALPPTPVTTAAPATLAPIGNVTGTPPSAPATRAQRAYVQYTNGELFVRANDSSLNQILRAVARQTGMKVTGGVAEERVFGSYGPANPSTLLASLLDGTNTNVLILEATDDRPTELVLTPRTAGPTPASPTSSEYAEYDQPDPAAAAPPPNPAPAHSNGPVQPSPSVQPAPSVQPSPSVQPGSTVAATTPSTPPSIPQPANNVLGSPSNTTPTASEIPTLHSVPIDSLPTPSTTVSTQQGIVDTPNPPPATQPAVQSGTGIPQTAPPASSGPLTPQDVLRKLQQMQQQSGGTPPQ
jgi:hypothetical protein